MSDDAPRSAQGNRPDQRRGRGAPAWWDLLQRSDLPDDTATHGGAVDTAGWDVRDAFPGTQGRRGRAGRVVMVVAAVLVGLAVLSGLWMVMALSGRSAASTALVIVGVPGALLVASVAASLARRRRRH
jgi:hypothetical protein